MPIDLNDALNEYRQNAPQAANKLARKYAARQGKVAAGTSENAQKAYTEAMRDPTVLERRRRNLAKLTDEDLNRAMAEKGVSNYATGVAAGADKWARGFQPYAGVIDATRNNLPARTRDPLANLTNRAGPFVKNLSDAKKKMG